MVKSKIGSSIRDILISFFSIFLNTIDWGDYLLARASSKGSRRNKKSKLEKSQRDKQLIMVF